MKDATISTTCLPDLIGCPSPDVLRGRPGAEAGANTSGLDGRGVNPRRHLRRHDRQNRLRFAWRCARRSCFVTLKTCAFVDVALLPPPGSFFGRADVFANCHRLEFAPLCRNNFGAPDRLLRRIANGDETFQRLLLGVVQSDGGG